MKQSKEDKDNASELNHECYIRGCKLFDASEFQKAASEFKQSIEYWPEDSHAWMALGNCYSELKKHKKAEEAFLHSLEYSKETDKENILFNLGNALFDQKRFPEAIEEYQKIKPGSELWKKCQRNIMLAKSNESNN